MFLDWTTNVVDIINFHILAHKHLYWGYIVSVKIDFMAAWPLTRYEGAAISNLASKLQETRNKPSSSVHVYVSKYTGYFLRCVLKINL